MAGRLDRKYQLKNIIRSPGALVGVTVTAVVVFSQLMRDRLNGKSRLLIGERMKALRIFALAAISCLGFSSLACETSHTETDKPGMFGGHVHEETTTTHNPITNTDDKTHTQTKTP
jgi:hypothetical protein